MKIAVIDDYQDAFRKTKAFPKLAGHEVTVFTDTEKDPDKLAARLKSDEQLRAVPVVAFFSHVETELRRKALEAGVEHVLPRSVFTQRLGEILSGEL